MSVFCIFTQILFYVLQTTKTLEVSDLSIGYKNLKIADSISFSLEKGKLTALLGANGIGKSTLLRTLTTAQPLLSGTILLNGKNIAEFSQKELAQQLSVVLTEKLPPSNLSVYEVVALGRQPYTNWLGDLSPVDQQKTREAIEQVQIEELTHKKHFELSDGQLQKVLIARALAQDTDLVILDEPTTHLDLVHKASVIRLLKKLTRQTQKSILFSTHDIDLALEFCDEIIVMTSQKTEKDTPENLIQKGTFDKLFEGESVYFDKEKRKFVF